MAKCGVTLVLVFGCYLVSGLSFMDGPDEIKQKVFVHFSPDNVKVVEFPLGRFPDLYNDIAFNRTRPTAIYFHGWITSTRDPSVLSLTSAYAGYNFVAIDWSAYASNPNYLKVIPQLKAIAEVFASLLRQFLENGYDIELLHLVGHSMGGQAVGKVARHLKKISLGKFEVPVVIGLDPAGPGFEGVSMSGFEAISSSDAKYVQIIHTSLFRGMQTQAGTIDFYPNGGLRQPGCEKVLTSDDSCNHQRAWQLYQAALRNPTGFPAVKCASYDDFLIIDKGGNCDKTKIAYVGLNANKSLTGKYFLMTNGNMFRFSKGEAGLRPSTTKQENAN